MNLAELPVDVDEPLLTERWTPLRRHGTQQRYWTSQHRFNVVPAGRRSGKTEIAKRRVARAAVKAAFPWPAKYFCGAPTRDQAKRIYWDDLKRLIPDWMKLDVSESNLMIQLITMNEIWVVGMDKPQRIEGTPWDGGVLDEFGNMKPKAWAENVRPSLSDREGWCDLIGVPEGRNHYYDVHQIALAQQAADGETSEWGAFSWPSSDILPAKEIEAAKRDLDELSYDQEYNASFVNFSGRAYYPFEQSRHTTNLRPLYNKRAPLIFCFDFNVEPGVAAVVQEGALGTLVIGEVWIPRNSNTPAVCNKLIHDWGTHEGLVYAYGDATGGSRGSAKTEGSDWDLINRILRAHFKERYVCRVKPSNPTERSRVNAVNSRLLSMSKEVRLFVDPKYAPHVVKDLEGVTLLEGGSGELDKDRDENRELTHISDALGYYVEAIFPVSERGMKRIIIGGA